MRSFVMCAGVLAALVCLPAVASADWFDDFDSYTPGNQIVGQGGWEEWAPNNGALVSNLYSQSPANSVEVMTATDLVHQYAGYTYGKWVYTAYQYIPGTFSGTTYFILLNTYAYPSGPYDWSVQVGFDSATGMLDADCGSSNPVTNVPYVTDQWIKIECHVDLHLDWCQVYYNGTLLDDPALPDHPVLGGGYQWTLGVFGGGGGILDIQAVDLFANGATPVYYDDMSLLPGPPSVDIKVNGSDDALQIPQADNVSLDVSISAGNQFGVNHDHWVVVKSNWGWFSYLGGGYWANNGAFPYQAAFTGPIFDVETANVLNKTLPLGPYKAYIAVESPANGSLLPWPPPTLYMDSVDFDVVP